MNFINKQIQNIYGVSDNDYAKWCSDNGLKRNKTSVREYLCYLRKKVLEEIK